MPGDTLEPAGVLAAVPECPAGAVDRLGEEDLRLAVGEGEELLVGIVRVKPAAGEVDERAANGGIHGDAPRPPVLREFDRDGVRQDVHVPPAEARLSLNRNPVWTATVKAGRSRSGSASRMACSSAGDRNASLWPVSLIFRIPLTGFVG